MLGHSIICTTLHYSNQQTSKTSNSILCNDSHRTNLCTSMPHQKQLFYEWPSCFHLCQIAFNFFSSLQFYGFNVPEVPAIHSFQVLHWKRKSLFWHHELMMHNFLSISGRYIYTANFLSYSIPNLHFPWSDVAIHFHFIRSAMKHTKYTYYIIM